MEKLKKITLIPWFLSLIIFAIVFSGSLVLRLQSDSFISGNDPYYHARRSFSVSSNELFFLPEFSTQANSSLDLYPLYHAFMSPFVSDFDGTNYATLIIGSKIFHSLVLATVFTLFFILLFKLLKREELRQKYTWALFGTWGLYLFSNIFSFRMLLERPHVVSIIFILVCIYAVISKRSFLLVSTTLLFPFFYSFSVLILLIPILYIPVALIYKIRKYDAIKPFLYSLLGLCAGIILLPDPLGYIKNAYGVHFVSLYQSTIGNMHGVPAELGSGIERVNNEVWLLLFCATLIFWVFFMIRKKSIRALPITISYLGVLAISFTVGFFIISRTIEYTVPLVLLFIFVAIPYLYQKTSCFTMLFAFVLPIDTIKLKMILKYGQYGLVFFLLLYSFARTYTLVENSKRAPSYQTYAGVHSILKQKAVEADIVYIPRFGMFPEQFFFNPALKYTSGMDPAFTYQYDKTIFWKLHHLAYDTTICGKEVCIGNASLDAYSLLHDELGVRFMILNKQYFSKTEQSPLFTKIETDNRFQNIFSDPAYPDIVLYEL